MGLNLRESMKTGRLIGVAVSRLVGLLDFSWILVDHAAVFLCPFIGESDMRNSISASVQLSLCLGGKCFWRDFVNDFCTYLFALVKDRIINGSS